jgi:hypothetical protein
MSALIRRGEDGRMEPGEDLSRRASELLEDARRFRSAAAQRGSHRYVPDALVSLEEALQVLSGAWYQLAADAAPRIVERRLGDGSAAPSRPPRGDSPANRRFVRVMGTLHDVAAGFARCARGCREAQAAVTPTIGKRASPGRADNGRQPGKFPRFQRHDRPGQRVA